MHLPVLTLSVDHRSNNMGAEGTTAVSEALHYLPDLRTLDLA